MHFSFVTNEDPAQLGRGHLIGEVGGRKRTRVDAYVDIKIVEIEAIQRFIQRSQGSDFVYPTKRATATKGKPNAWSGFNLCACYRPVPLAFPKVSLSLT